MNPSNEISLMSSKPTHHYLAAFISMSALLLNSGCGSSDSYAEVEKKFEKDKLTYVAFKNLLEKCPDCVWENQDTK